MKFIRVMLSLFIRAAVSLFLALALALILLCACFAYHVYFPTVEIRDNFGQETGPTTKRSLGVPVDSFRAVDIVFAWHPERRPMNMDKVFFYFAFPSTNLTGGNATSIDLSSIAQPLSDESKAFREQWLAAAFKYAPDGFAAQSQLVGVNCSNLEERKIVYVFFDPNTKNIFLLTVQKEYFDLVKETTDWQTCLKNQKLPSETTTPAV